MKHYDFLFYYENKVREFESICLIANELERRGYTTHFLSGFDNELYPKPLVDADVIITSALYNDKTLDFVASHIWQLRKVINLQWEQVFPQFIEENPKSDNAVTGRAVEGFHICWGQNRWDKLVNEFGVPEENAEITGHVAMDFLRPELAGRYLSREELEEKYQVIKGKKVYLFISSFALVNMPEYHLQRMFESEGDNIFKRREVHVEGQKQILKWLETELPKHDDVIFVYRPHPSEINGELLNNAEKTIPNFVIIPDESVNQWIQIADKIYTNTSTAIAQVYSARKTCEILRPVEIPEVYDMPVFIGCKSCTEFEEFSRNFNRTDLPFPIDKKIFSQYYYMDDNELTYQKICNAAENVLKDDRYMISYPKRYKRRFLYPLIELRSLKRRFLARIGSSGFEYLPKSVKIGAERYIRSVNMWKRNYATEDEISELKKKISEVLSNNE